ncbi:HEAT repeat domain-containing protein, partial [Actinoplanes campanulatus]|uniref:HEAT repeat domain-containing protein n=1 Tax=Actinoplanes campanulatus TaxID=113559 RepID=UPI0031DF40D2
GDDDVLLRPAALAAAAGIGCPPPLAATAVTSLGDPAWQVREGVAKGLAAVETDVAAPALSGAVRDGNLDVRKAAVRSLAAWAAADDVAAALRAAGVDPDADVRAWARRGTATAGNGR